MESIINPLITQFNTVLDIWDITRDAKYLLSVAHFLELAREEFYLNEIDPFDNRPPSKIIPGCTFGQMVASILNKDNFVPLICNDDILHEDCRNLLELSCQLILEMLHEIDFNVIKGDLGEILIPLLYWWARSDENETLKYCSVGILAFIMRIPEFKTKHKQHNLLLGAELLASLHKMKNKDKKIQHMSEPGFKYSETIPGTLVDTNFPSIDNKCSNLDPEIETTALIVFNRSTFDMHALKSLSKDLKQNYALKFLTLAYDYPEIAYFGYEKSMVYLIFYFLDLDSKQNDNTKFKVLHYLVSLTSHPNIAIEFINLGGLEKLMNTPKPSSASYGVLRCLCCFSENNKIMKIIKHQPMAMIKDMIAYVLWACEYSKDSCCYYATIFMQHMMKYKYFLDEFDKQDGIRKIVRILSELVMSYSNLSLINIIDSDVGKRLKQMFRIICETLQNYFEAHAIFKSEELKCHNSISKPNVSLSDEAHIDFQTVKESIKHLLKTFHTIESWKPVTAFVKLNGIPLLLNLINTHICVMSPKEERTLRSAFNILIVCSMVSKAQLQFYEMMPVTLATKFQYIIGLNMILDVASAYVAPKMNVQILALRILTNCICHKNCLNTIYKKKVCKKICDAVRNGNGLMILLKLLNTKKPLSEADYIRTLSIKILCELIKCPNIKKLIGKQCIVTAENLEILMDEPVFSEKQKEHLQFCKYAKQLIEKAFNFSSNSTNTSRMCIVNSTKITYSQNQLMLLIQQYLSDNNYYQTANILAEEANLSLFTESKKSDEIHCEHLFSEPVGISLDITLSSIVNDYLHRQHSYNNNPAMTRPLFDLSNAHKNQEQKYQNLGSTSITSRLVDREMGIRPIVQESARLMRDFVYSRVKPIKSLKLNLGLTCCSFSEVNDYILVGTNDGFVKLYDLSDEKRDISFECLPHAISYIEESKSSRFLLTSSIYNTSALWLFQGYLDKLDSFNDSYAEFSKLTEEYIIGTSKSVSHVYNIESCKLIRTFHEEYSNKYSHNKATFNPSDQLILSDGILWDVRKKGKVHKFDKFNTEVSGIFHPAKLEIIANMEIWDLRTFGLIKTVSSLNQCKVCFNSSSDVLYAALRHAPMFTMDSTDYSKISTINADMNIKDFAIKKSEELICMIEDNTDTIRTNHENICRVYEVGKCEDRFKMEEKTEEYAYPTRQTQANLENVEELESESDIIEEIDIDIDHDSYDEDSLHSDNSFSE